MSHFQLVLLCASLTLLILLSGFFSIAETSLLSINRYRLRHLARLKKPHAILILKLLKRPDRLLGMVLIGNNIANIIASSITTLLALKLFGDTGVVISTIVLSLIILIFSEVGPKTFAAIYPEAVSKAIAYPVKIFLIIFYPLVWFINALANSVLKIFQVDLTRTAEPISREELRSFVYDTSGRISQRHQNMLLGILDLNKITVDDVMVPTHEIAGIDLEEPWEMIQKKLVKSLHEWVPVYREDIEKIVGILHLRSVLAQYVAGKEFDKNSITQMLQEPYFIPSGTPLNTQLINFQQQHKRFALVVNEYGEIQGLVTLEDILEEIVGEFSTSLSPPEKIALQDDGSYRVDGAITLRELNKMTGWKLPSRGARTLNGLIIEYLESMPTADTCIKIAGYPIEIIEVKDNRVTLAKLFPRIVTNDSIK